MRTKEQNRIANKKWRDNHKEENSKNASDYYYGHKEEISKTRKDFRDKNIDEVRERNRIAQRIFRENHKDRLQEKHKDYHRKIKLEVLIHYSGNPPKCECCGETIIDFLTMDHINNDGAEHRKKVGNGLYSWLKKNNYPEGYRVLCFNCNCGRSINNGVCPHKLNLAKSE